ncbi:MAG: SAM hydrolase/SAM-dependent halogenase family protein, partial [Candidatus Binataceae bacterium]
VMAGALALRESWRYFPKRTIFLAVVDPGVGTARLPIAIETRAGARFIGPDNGLLWQAATQAGVVRAVELRSSRYRMKTVSATFHGRDIFAPAAAHMWRGVRLDALGPRLAVIEALEFDPAYASGRELRGSVVYVDGFGNLVTNINRAAVERFARHFRGRRLSVRIGRGAAIEIRKAYGDAPEGAPLATFGSFDMLEVAVRGSSAALRFGAGVGVRVTLRPSK